MKRILGLLLIGLACIPIYASQFIVRVTPAPPVVTDTCAVAANCYYIRAGGSASTTGTGACVGSGIGSWATAGACDDLPTTLVRGATYYVATGTYAARTFNTAVSGTTLITIQGATATDHGTNTSWLAAYGVDVTQATWDNPRFSTSYHVFTGSVGSLTTARASYGFAVTQTLIDNSAAISLSGTVSNLTIAHTAMLAPSGDVEKTAIRGTGTGIATSLTVQHNLADGFQGSVVSEGSTGTSTGWLIEYNYFWHGYSSAAQHGEVINANGRAITAPIIRYNTFADNTGPSCQTGIIAANNSPVTDPEIYGNIFDTVHGCNGILTSTSSGKMSNALVYNNTFYNSTIDGGCWVAGGGGGGANESSGFQVHNNLVANMDACLGTGITAHTNNFYVSTTNTPVEATRQTSSSNQFVDGPGGNFHLIGATTAGASFAAPYNTDVDGTTRGADGTWDRGAYEFN